MTKSQFSPDEWRLLLNAPRWVYVALAAAERGSISTRRTEAKALDEFLSGYRTRSPLVREIIAGQDEADDKLSGSLQEAERTLDQVGTLLERKASDDEGDAVRDMLMQAGKAVAVATREALFGDAESAKEAQALARIETALKATEADTRRRREAAAAKEAREAQAQAAAELRREEAARAQAEAKAKREAAEAKAKREAAEAEVKKKMAEAKAKREAAEAEVKKKAAEAKAKREAAEAEAKRKAAEAEVQRKLEEAREKREAEARGLEEKRALREAETPAPTVQAAPQSAERIYVVKKGDTLSGIAKTVYGNAGRWREIFEANRDVIDKPNLIRPGWKLRIPE